jgi:hypothetical protein
MGAPQKTRKGTKRSNKKVLPHRHANLSPEDFDLDVSRKRALLALQVWRPTPLLLSVGSAYGISVNACTNLLTRWVTLLAHQTHSLVSVFTDPGRFGRISLRYGRI